MPRVNVKDQRKQQLIEANLQCIAKLGLERTTIADVSEAAGLSRGIVNFYFESKDKMMAETLKSLLEGYHAQLDKALAVQPENMPEAVITAHFSPKLLAPRFLACWLAFMGQAATVKEYRNIIGMAEQETLAKLAGLPDAAALLALIRGQWLACLLTPGAEKERMMETCRAFAARPRAEVVELAAHKRARKSEAGLPEFDFADMLSTAR